MYVLSWTFSSPSEPPIATWKTRKTGSRTFIAGGCSQKATQKPSPRAWFKHRSNGDDPKRGKDGKD